MQNRLKNKNTNNPDVWKAVGHLQKAIAAGGVDPKLLALVHLHSSQINSCSACLYASVAGGKKASDTDERLHNVAAWREAPFCTDAEPAALAPAEAATRLQDGAEGVTDEIWEEANAQRPFLPHPPGRSSTRTGRPMQKFLAGVVLGSPTAATPNPSPSGA
ncbi:carboxymuconolactone decarboxylase family protein [Streptomyces sp. NPDC030592]|uniref:carboxymuconolactone decarboxylase family protein n=1 Tax=Streptomyces sp. NPDC030592 TaxID=3155365 RepID=UPI003411684F